MTYTLDDLSSDRGLARAFQYLIPVAEAGASIPYGEIAERLASDLSIEGRIFPTHIGHVAGSLMDRILDSFPAAPLINVLVVNQRNGQPSEGVDRYLRRKFNLRKVPAIGSPAREALVSEAAATAYACKDWRRIYEKLFGKVPPRLEAASLVRGTEADGLPPARFGGPAESKEHIRLKEYIFQHPTKVGAPGRPDVADMELMLLSGDEVDVFFSRNHIVHLIEVKSIRSSEPDLKRGVYQCVKYRAVMKAQRKGTMPNLRVISSLVVESEPPAHIRDLAKSHGVRLVVVRVN